jgi:hypothetical protein
MTRCGPYHRGMPNPPAEIDLQPLCVAWESVAKVPCGPLGRECLAHFEDQRFDQVVVVEGDSPLGMVRTGRLRRLHERGEPLRPDTRRIIRRAFVPPRIPLDRLLEALEASPAVIVREEGGEPRGLFAMSDLNRHEFRSLLYPMLAELERRLVSGIEHSFLDRFGLDWVKCLPTYRQIAIHGGWELARRNRIETTPVACASLSDLLKAAEHHDAVRESIVEESRTKWGKRAKRINDLRNRVMHPARPLIAKNRRDAVESLRRDFEALAGLLVDR